MSKVYLIGTAHQQYRQRSFEPGDVVIDPWRMIPGQQGVTVRRLGENKPAQIAVLIPSRGRPEALRRTIDSARQTATHERQVTFYVYLDSDDPMRSEYLKAPSIPTVTYLGQPRKLLSECWNDLCSLSAVHGAEIHMHGGDDLVFSTPGWDQMVRDAFAASDDKILLVQGDDLSPNREALATHGFVHRRWVETVGYFLPPLFSCDWNDVWLTEVADAIGRRVILPFVTEHAHYSFSKRERDDTDLEREERGRADDVVGIYQRTKADRERDAAKLRAVLGTS